MKIKNLTKRFSVETEVARNVFKQGLGLSFRRKKSNMFFIFSLKRKWEFWMFGMFFPLKIIFINKNKRVINVFTAKPLTLSPKTWRIYKAKKKCKYVLELGKDINKKFEIGDKLSW